jgi:dynein heavy chain 1
MLRSFLLIFFVDPNTIFSMGLDVEFTEERSIWIAFIKKQPNFVIDVSRSVASQLQVIELGEGSPLETLHTLLHNSISPYVRSYVKSRSQKIEGTKERAPKAGRKCLSRSRCCVLNE